MIVPVRVALVLLAATCSGRARARDVVPPSVIVIHGTFVVAVHGQLPGVMTVKRPFVPPFAVKGRTVG
jgi:hypothetical protein